jgi:F-box and leucine-rich repeat protein 14
VSQPSSCMNEAMPRVAASTIRSFRIDGTVSLSSDDVASILQIPSLTSLELGNSGQLDDTVFASVQTSQRQQQPVAALTTLRLGQCPLNVSNSCVSSIAKLFSQLQSLEICGSSVVTALCISCLTPLQRLTTLSFAGCDGFGDLGLSELGYIASLTSLNIDSCKNVSNKGLKIISERTSSRLRSLSAANIWCNNEGLVHIAKMTELRHLCLSHNIGFDDDGLSHLKALEALTSINLDECTNLTLLSSLVCLLKLPKLQSISMAQCNNATCDCIDELLCRDDPTKLTVLALPHCELTDAAVVALTKSRHIADLDLHDNVHLTDVALACLASMVTLERLNIVGCEGISSAAVADFLVKNKSTFIQV